MQTEPFFKTVHDQQELSRAPETIANWHSSGLAAHAHTVANTINKCEASKGIATEDDQDPRDVNYNV